MNHSTKPNTGKTITIVGSGATGSHLAYQLVKLGVPRLDLWDKDQIEEHNIANQWYTQRQLGELKVNALKENILQVNSTCVVNTYPEFLTSEHDKLEGIVVLLVDDMETRKEIWERHVKFNPNVPFMIEARMGTHHGQIFTIDPMNMDEIGLWESMWFPNEAVREEVTACGGSQTMCPTASILAGYMAWQLVNVVNGDDYQRNLTLGISPAVIA